jgi:predicted RNA binding protein YcfA (HicA-like mRNA interferase family)
MPVFGPMKRKELIHFLRQLRFSGPHSGGKHQYLVKGELRLYIPNPHEGDFSRELLSRILRQAGVAREDWERLQ